MLEILTWEHITEYFKYMILARWFPDTCECVADPNNKRLIHKCRTHRTFTEMQAHNKTFQSQTRMLLRDAELKKKEFQTTDTTNPRIKERTRA